MKRFLGSALVVLASTVPFAAFADVSGNNVTLNSNTTLNLDTGSTTSGGDLKWTGTGTGFTVVGSAKDIDLTTTLGATYSGQSGYTTLVQQGQALISTFSAFASFLATAAITPTANDILVVKTNGGNYAAVLVVSVGASVTIDYHTFTGSSGGGGGGTTPSGPTITGVVNNYSYIPAGFPNSGIAPSSIMLIFGSGMSQPPPAVLALNSSASPGIPTTSAGATLQVKASDGSTYTPGIYYATPTQIAAVLPAKVPTGTATITVTYNNQTSNAYQFQVVPAAVGLDTYFGTGSGLLTATTTNYVLFTYTNSAKPGDTIILWGSGLGADTADSDTVYTTSPHSVGTLPKVYFGGVAGTVLYAGSAGFPGVNQINVTIPSNAPTDCYVGVTLVAGNGTVSNSGTLPISTSGGQCSSSVLGTSGTTISTLSGQGTVRSGAVFVGQTIGPKSDTDNTPQTSNVAFASFQKETGASYSSDTSNGGSAFSIGSCYVSEVISTSGGGGTVTGLDAGNLTLTGPNGMYTLMKLPIVAGTYIGSLPDNAITSSGGAFTFNGSGGADVGSFNTTINLPNPLLTWTNQSADATVSRSSGVTVNWTGGAAGSYVIISGDSTDSATGADGSFTCIANQSALTFTVPSYITGALPAGTGQLSVANDAGFGTFTATGIDVGVKFGYTSTSINATYH